MQKTEAAEHIQLVTHTPIDLAVDRVTVKGEPARSKIVVSETGQVRVREEAVNLLRNEPARRVQQASRNDVLAARIRNRVAARVAGAAIGRRFEVSASAVPETSV